MVSRHRITESESIAITAFIQLALELQMPHNIREINSAKIRAWDTPAFMSSDHFEERDVTFILFPENKGGHDELQRSLTVTLTYASPASIRGEWKVLRIKIATRQYREVATEIYEASELNVASYPEPPNPLHVFAFKKVEVGKDT